MPITLRDIAERVGVSVATVSRVLNKQGDPFISDATRERVMDAAKDMGYRPNAAARALATGRTRIIMLATAGVYSPYYALVARNVTRLALENGYLVTTVPNPAALDLDVPPVPPLLWPADGVILADTALPPGIAADLAPGTPLVGIGVYAPAEGDSVSTDLHHGALEAVRHLVSTGRKRIAYLFNADLEWVSDPRTRAYQAVLQEAGLPAERMSLPGASRADARQFVAEYVRTHGCPGAIFCKNDDMAIGCYRGLRDLGYRIPEDCALVGCDGIEDTEYLDPPLSTIVQPVATMCRVAWEFLERRMAEPTRLPQRAVLRPEFQVRPSSIVSPTGQ